MDDVKQSSWCRLIARAAVLGALVGAPQTAANAQPFGPGACGGACYYADNSTETYFYNALTVGDVQAIDFARYSRLEPTDMTTQVQTSSYNSDTDIIVYDANYPNTWWGLWQCTALVAGSSTKCNQGSISFNLTKGTANYALACQEQGHGVGLDHSTSTGSCMYQNADVAATDYDAHDKGHINGYY